MQPGLSNATVEYKNSPNAQPNFEISSDRSERERLDGNGLVFIFLLIWFEKKYYFQSKMESKKNFVTIRENPSYLGYCMN